MRKRNVAPSRSTYGNDQLLLQAYRRAGGSLLDKHTVRHEPHCEKAAQEVPHFFSVYKCTCNCRLFVDGTEWDGEPLVEEED